MSINDLNGKAPISDSIYIKPFNSNTVVNSERDVGAFSVSQKSGSCITRGQYWITCGSSDCHLDAQINVHDSSNQLKLQQWETFDFKSGESKIISIVGMMDIEANDTIHFHFIPSSSITINEGATFVNALVN